MRKVKYQDIGLFTDKLAIFANEPGVGGASTAYTVRVITDGKEEGFSVNRVEDLEIKFQVGNPLENVNGLTNEALLSILIDRMQGFQSGDFATKEGAIILTKLKEALLWMFKRTLDRRDRGVEGKQEK